MLDIEGESLRDRLGRERQWPVADAVRIAGDAFDRPYLEHPLARIYIALGEPDQALDIIEHLLTVPYHLTPAWVAIDPNFAPLRTNPRFQRLVGVR